MATHPQDVLPQAGGSYVRAADGTPVPVEQSNPAAPVLTSDPNAPPAVPASDTPAQE